MKSRTNYSQLTAELIFQSLDQIGICISKAKALISLGMEIDGSEYEHETLSDYLGVVHDLLHQIDENKQKITFTLTNLIQQIETIKG